MKIESKIRRQGGTKVPMGDKTYHFAPSEGDDRHVAEVTDDDHVAAFLKIGEGYRVAKKDGAEQSQPTTAPTLTPTPSPVSNATAAPDPNASLASPAPGATEAPVRDLPPFGRGSMDLGVPGSTATLAPEQPDELDDKSKADLIETAKAEGIDVSEKLPKPAIIAQIRTARGTNAKPGQSTPDVNPGSNAGS